MAKEEEKTNAPAYIDYESSTSVEPESWTARNVERFFAETLVKKRKVSAHPFALKTMSLAKRMLHEFDPEDLRLMINYWSEFADLGDAGDFVRFYTLRHKVYDKAKPKDYDEWEF